MLRGAAVAALALLLSLVTAATARADEVVVCPPGGTVCYVVVETPGDAATEPAPQPVSHADPAKPVCRMPVSGAPVACFDDVFGWWSNADGCYYQRLDPQPPRRILHGKATTRPALSTR